MSRTIHDVEIFAAGTWNGSKFTVEDLHEIAKATNTLLTEGTHKPPLKIGHSETQILYGQDDGFPALGWLDNVRVSGSKLIADFIDVPDILIQAFSKGLYRQVSVEMRHIDYIGWVLTAAAVLGADLPAVKTLQDLDLYLSDTAHHQALTRAEEPLCFSAHHPILHQETTMDTTDQVAVLQAKLAAQDAQLASFKQRELDAKFSQARQNVLGTYQEDVRAGRLAPSTLAKIESYMDSSRQNFSQSEQISFPAELVAEISKGYSHSFSQAQQAVAGSDEVQGDADEKVEAAVFKHMALTGKKYAESFETVLRVNPLLAKEYKAYTVKIAQGGR